MTAVKTPKTVSEELFNAVYDALNVDDPRAKRALYSMRVLGKSKIQSRRAAGVDEGKLVRVSRRFDDALRVHESGS